LLASILVAGAFSATVARQKVEPRPSRLRLLAKVPIPSLGAGILALPNGRELYVSQNDGHVIIIDPEKRVITMSLVVAPQPQGLAITPDGSTIYVAHASGMLTSINTQSKASSTIPLKGALIAATITPDGRYVYLPACSAGLQRLDRTTGTVNTVRQGRCPTFAVASPDGEHLWVSYQTAGPGGRSGHDAIADFNPHTGELLGSITGLPQVGGLVALSPNGSSLWAHALDACSNVAYDHLGCAVVPSAVIHVIDAASRQRVRSIVFPGQGVTTDRFAISPDGRWVAIGGFKLRLLDARTTTIVRQDTMAPTYWAVAFSKNGRRLFALSSNGPALRIYAME
jgi:DNA-binding beta-propeller fold protein YncE